ncbi:MAG: ATP-dependent DNA helicase [Alphaproteobacteria bacterium]
MSAASTLPHELPALVATRSFASWRAPSGESEALGAEEAVRRAQASPPILCHAPAISRRLGVDHVEGYDVLELFALARPAQFTLPTIRGLARTLSINAPDSAEDVEVLIAVASALLNDIATNKDEHGELIGIARALQRAGWLWGPFVLDALGVDAMSDQGAAAATSALAVWRKVPEWTESAPEPPPANDAVSEDEARDRLEVLLGDGSESREGQRDYAAAAAAAFAPPTAPDTPNIVLAEAGTGTGKTLGYIAPASVWSEKNAGPVWISTYTRNLQQQIDQELDHLYPDPDVKARQVVIRKGRENYLCLLNLEDVAGRFTGLQRRNAVGVALTARWVQATRDGDLGGDFPAWLVDLVGVGATLGLADRRGECIYSACSHYSRCFVEHSIRKARRARLVVANHALVMIQAAMGGIGGDNNTLPTRYVLDEGHHIFDAADSAFAAHLSGREMADLRRWLLGAEGSGRRRPGSRARGLRERVEDLIAADDSDATEALAAALEAAQVLPAPAWLNRLSGNSPQGAAEAFLAECRLQVYARAPENHGPYSLETDVRPPAEELPGAAEELRDALVALATPLRKLCTRLLRRLDEDADELESATRVRIEAVSKALQRRAEMTLGAWIDMLDSINEPASDSFVDWMEVERIDGREIDAGLFRHWVDPTVPFAASMAPVAHGMVITSATLTDRTGDAEADWRTAESRTGSIHLPKPAIRSRVESPFDYGTQTKVFVVTDVRRNDADQVAAAMRELFLASGGGALGLFTSIARLRQVHARMADALDSAGLPLYGQHVDQLNVATLIDIFRAETDACLLGTDAVRDGVDVPGRSLRMLAFDRIPWPRPTILHRARRDAFGGRNYDDMLARLRLAQAYGRLIRRRDDRGVFVVLDAATPTRLFGAFPESVTPERVGLVDAIEATEEFLAD